MVSALLAVALYGAAASSLGGLCWRIWRWGVTPEPFQIPTTTGQQPSIEGIAASRIESPSTRWGVVARMALELFLFRSLFRNTAAGPTFGSGEVAARPIFLERKGLWLGALAFHWSLLVVVVRHLRLLVEPPPRIAETAAGLLNSIGLENVGLERFRADESVSESSLKYAYHWYKTAVDLFSPPESRWIRLSRRKMDEAKELWKAELRAKKIQFEEYMLE